jgi:predicted phage-related endonuclease
MNFTGNEVLGGLTAEQIAARLGKLTASRMKDAMDFNKNGGESEKRKSYKMELVAERMTDIIVPHYVTPAMQWGIENEPAAKLAYQELTGRTIRPADFYPHPTIEYCGATPDGLIDPDGLIECKCPTTTKYIAWLTAGIVPEEHRPQMALQVLCSGRKWVDFVAFDPRMPKAKQVFVRRYEPEADYLRKVEDAAKQFLAEVDALFEQVLEAA